LTCNIRSSCAFAGPANNAKTNNAVPILLIRDPSRQGHCALPHRTAKVYLKSWGLA
jgi:hypothetical protein